MATEYADRDFLEFIIKSIVDHPEEVTVDVQGEEGRTVFLIHANSQDYGKIIGKNGRIISALRDLIKLMATKENLYVDLVIAE